MFVQVSVETYIAPNSQFVIANMAHMMRLWRRRRRNATYFCLL